MIDAYTAAAFRLLILTGVAFARFCILKMGVCGLSTWPAPAARQQDGAESDSGQCPVPALLQKIERAGQYVIASGDPDRPKADLNRPWRTIFQPRWSSGRPGYTIFGIRMPASAQPLA